MWGHCRASVAGMLLLPFGAFEPAVAGPHGVLLLHSFEQHFHPWSAVAARLHEELVRQSPSPIDIYEASLETARFSQPLDCMAADRALRPTIRAAGIRASFRSPPSGRLGEHFEHSQRVSGEL